MPKGNRSQGFVNVSERDAAWEAANGSQSTRKAPKRWSASIIIGGVGDAPIARAQSQYDQIVARLAEANANASVRVTDKTSATTQRRSVSIMHNAGGSRTSYDAQTFAKAGTSQDAYSAALALIAKVRKAAKADAE